MKRRMLVVDPDDSVRMMLLAGMKLAKLDESFEIDMLPAAATGIDWIKEKPPYHLAVVTGGGRKDETSASVMLVRALKSSNSAMNIISMSSDPEAIHLHIAAGAGHVSQKAALISYIKSNNL